MEEKEQWAYSHNQENYHGKYDSIEEAAAAAFEDDDERDVAWVGVCVTPKPEDCIDAYDIIERIEEQEEFSSEWAEGWPGETKKQREELTADVRRVFVEWMKRHKLEPKFYNIDEPREVRRPE